MRYVNSRVTVAPGQRVLRFADTSLMSVELGLPDRLIGRLTPGKEVPVEVSGFEGLPPFSWPRFGGGRSGQHRGSAISRRDQSAQPGGLAAFRDDGAHSRGRYCGGKTGHGLCSPLGSGHPGSRWAFGRKWPGPVGGLFGPGWQSSDSGGEDRRHSQQLHSYHRRPARRGAGGDLGREFSI